VFDMGQFSGSSSPHAGSRCLISFHCSSTRLQRTKKPSLSWLPCDALDFRFSGAKRVPCSREPRVRIALPPLSPTAPLEHGTSTPPRRRARRHRRSPDRRARRRSQRRELGSRAAVDWGSARRSCRSPARRGRVVARGGAEHGWSKPAPVSPSAAALAVFLTRDIPKLAASPAAAQAKRRSPLLHRRPRPTSFVQRPRPAPTAVGSVAGDGDLRVGLSEAAGLVHRGPGAGTRTPAVLSSTSSGG